MNTPAPPAARFFYALAIISGMLAFAFLLIAIYGGELDASEDWYELAIFAGFWGYVAAAEAVLAAGFFGAIGAVIHDLRRIAENTAATALSAAAAAPRPPSESDTSQSPAPESAAASPVRIEYYYYDRDVEHGPVTRARIRDLIRTKRLGTNQRIERSVDGVREACDPREFGA